jgi:2-oxoisovalerate dehydrogenase E1 component alpha subunit
MNGLRAILAQEYPFQQKEIATSGLIHANQYPYPDTDSNNTLLRAHRQMIRVRQMDDVLLAAQRQGRIAFYMTCTGEEAIHMGAASALEVGDPIFAQYREQGLLMWRGFTLEQFTNQCFSNNLDLGKGRQMPIHYGSKALNYHTVSSPLGTQLPQAVGAAYRLKLAGKRNIAICFFGDGCASTTDFHSAMNFAATLKAPVVFFCRNNGYAISTPSSDQYAGDGVVSRAPGYGMAAIRVDGNDIFAVHAAVREAKKYALENHAPVLIESMTYRQGHHSSSDDSSSYRDTAAVHECAQNNDPIDRLESFLKDHHLMSDEQSAAIRNQERSNVLRAMEQAERRPKPPMECLFTDVYKEMPPALVRQQQQLEEHMQKYPGKY